MIEYSMRQELFECNFVHVHQYRSRSLSDQGRSLITPNIFFPSVPLKENLDNDGAFVCVDQEHENVPWWSLSFSLIETYLGDCHLALYCQRAYVSLIKNVMPDQRM